MIILFSPTFSQKAEYKTPSTNPEGFAYRKGKEVMLLRVFLPAQHSYINLLIF